MTRGQRASLLLHPKTPILLQGRLTSWVWYIMHSHLACQFTVFGYMYLKTSNDNGLNKTERDFSVTLRNSPAGLCQGTEDSINLDPLQLQCGRRLGVQHECMQATQGEQEEGAKAPTCSL